MKIERDGCTFTIQVRDEVDAETLDTLLRNIALALHGNTAVDEHERVLPVARLSMTLDVNPRTRWR